MRCVNQASLQFGVPGCEGAAKATPEPNTNMARGCRRQPFISRSWEPDLGDKPVQYKFVREMRVLVCMLVIGCAGRSEGADSTAPAPVPSSSSGLPQLESDESMYIYAIKKIELLADRFETLNTKTAINLARVGAQTDEIAALRRRKSTRWAHARLSPLIISGCFSPFLPQAHLTTHSAHQAHTRAQYALLGTVVSTAWNNPS